VKSFGSLKAVDGVSFTLERGAILGFLGPNGAGKTTTVSMVAGLLAPDAGQVLVDGRALSGDADPAKGKLGLVPQDVALYEELTAQDNLRFFGSLQGMGRQAVDRAAAEVLGLVGLSERAKDKVKNYSGGMKRRLNLAAGLLHDPPVLLLDEPTVGVDPQSRNAIFETLETLRDRGKAILYTTHYMEEAERLCGRILIVDHGRVIAEDTLAGLQRLLPAGNKLAVELAAPLAADRLAGLSRLSGVLSVEPAAQGVSVALEDLGSGSAAVLSWLKASGAEVTHVASERAGLEEVFLSLTGRTLRDP
jgi:ABC-2 type transport system ATP-binding protein